MVSTHTMLRAALKHPLSGESGVHYTVSTHTMLRAALKHQLDHVALHDESSLDTHNAACGIETSSAENSSLSSGCLDTHNAACGIETSTSVDTASGSTCLDTHNAACGIETFIVEIPFPYPESLDTHNAACGIETVDEKKRVVTAIVSTHTMLRAALKHYLTWQIP